jgi:hypothetical protein
MLHTITSDVQVSTHEFWEDGNVQSITMVREFHKVTHMEATYKKSGT